MSDVSKPHSVQDAAHLIREEILTLNIMRPGTSVSSGLMASTQQALDLLDGLVEQHEALLAEWRDYRATTQDVIDGLQEQNEVVYQDVLKQMARAEAAEDRSTELQEQLEAAHAENERLRTAYGHNFSSARKLAELREQLEAAQKALADACDVAIWLTGLPCLHGSDAWPYWESDARPRLYKAMALLDSNPASKLEIDPFPDGDPPLTNPASSRLAGDAPDAASSLGMASEGGGVSNQESKP